MDLELKRIETERDLADAVALCYLYLGCNDTALYGYKAWQKRLNDGSSPLVCAKADGKIVSAVLGRAENADSLVVGYVACDKAYRRQGITKKLMAYFENEARKQGFKYITLGSDADGFYEKCGFKLIFQTHGQNIYQKIL